MSSVLGPKDTQDKWLTEVPISISKLTRATKLSQLLRYLLPSPGSSSTSHPAPYPNPLQPKLHSLGSSLGPHFLGPAPSLRSLVFCLHLSSSSLARPLSISSHGLVCSAGHAQSGPFPMPLAVLSLLSTIKTFSSTISRSGDVLSFIQSAPKKTLGPRPSGGCCPRGKPGSRHT